jgi:tetratricopeptide (TPR) repeat protein
MAKDKKVIPQSQSRPTPKKQKQIAKPLLDFSNLLTAHQEKLFKYAFFIVALLIFVVRPFFSSHFGPSGDELTHKALGDLSYDYLVSGGKNDSLFRFDPTSGREDPALLQNYGPLLEVTSAAIYKNLGTNPYQTRHLVLTLFTFLLFFFCGMAAYKIGGWRAGLIAMLFMLVSPRLLGESFNNPKDPPFAAGYVMALYGLLCLVSELPRPSWRTIILTMIGIGLAFSIRVGGLLLFPYTIIFVGLALLLREEWRERLLAFDFAYYRILILQIIVIFTGAWIIGIFSWPAALRNPLGQPFHALAIQSSYPTMISILFDGKVIGSNEVPWNYNPFYICATSPTIVILGFFIGLALLPFSRKTFNSYFLFMVLFVSLFPLFYIIYKKSALLNGWRHSYFTYTGIAVFAALTFEALFRIVKPKVWDYILYAVVGIGILLPSIFIVKNFPVVYVYFNEMAGGVDGTYGDYNLDYYAASAKPAADWMAQNVPYDSAQKVVSNNPGEFNESMIMDRGKWRAAYIRYRERNEKDWDYAIFLPQFVDPQMMKHGKFAPKGTIHKIMVDNSVVAMVVKRVSKDDYIGIEALKKNDLRSAIIHLESAVKQDDDNEIAWAYLGVAYASAGHRDEALQALSKSLSISPNYQLAQSYYNQIGQMK